MVISLLAVLATASSFAPGTCSVGELRQNDRYEYRVERIREFIDSASVIVRARAVSTLVPASSSAGGDADPRVTFEILERIREPDSLRRIVLRGIGVLNDDFNRDTVPYRMVRPAGQRGDCYAREYRLHAEYLLILGTRAGELTPHWKPLAPFNEQVRGQDDPWVMWVREAASRRK